MFEENILQMIRKAAKVNLPLTLGLEESTWQPNDSYECYELLFYFIWTERHLKRGVTNAGAGA